MIALYIYRGGGQDIVIAAALLAVAGVSDGLDGYLARRLNRISRLGVALDPVADKILAAVVVASLCAWRDFPLWLAAAIVGRDLIIMFGGIILLRGRTIVLPSNLTGKYAFSAIAALIGSYLLQFQFGIRLMTWLTLILLMASLIGYGRVFLRVRRDKPVPQFQDRSYLKVTRIVLTVGLSTLYLFRLYTDLIR